MVRTFEQGFNLTDRVQISVEDAHERLQRFIDKMRGQGYEVNGEFEKGTELPKELRVVVDISTGDKMEILRGLREAGLEGVYTSGGLSFVNEAGERKYF